MNEYGTATPYAASYVVLKSANKIAFLLRENTSWMSGYYGLPSGKTEWKESASAGAIREAKEEVGVDIAADDLQHLLTVHRHSGNSDWVDVFFEAARWSGEVHNAEPHVHSELVWLDPNHLPENVLPNVRNALVWIAQGERYAEDGWQNS